MDSELYRKFLEFEAKEHPVRMGQTRISWENLYERTKPQRSSKPSDILDSIYLEREMEDTVIMDKRVAAMLHDRIAGLEADLGKMRNQVRILKIIIGVLLLVIVILSWALASNIATIYG